DPTEFAQSLHKGSDPCALAYRRGAAKVSNGRHFARLLRARRKRPRHRAAEQRDELAPLHSITSSARARRVVGISRRNALAVCRLMMNSNFVARSTGSSLGFSPLRIRPQ